MKDSQSAFHHDVFINCPFDKEYLPLFQAVVFTIHLVGFRARFSTEMDAGNDRLAQIVQVIRSCKYGIHDISRIQPSHKLPRFNMPFELGIDMGFKSAGIGRYGTKNHLIMDTHRYRYRVFFSDLSGRDIKAHHNRVSTVIGIVRNWLNDAIKDTTRYPLPSGSLIYQEYQKFQHNLPAMCEEAGLRVGQITFNDYSFVVAKFIAERKRSKKAEPNTRHGDVLRITARKRT